MNQPGPLPIAGARGGGGAGLRPNPIGIGGNPYYAPDGGPLCTDADSPGGGGVLQQQDQGDDPDNLDNAHFMKRRVIRYGYGAEFETFGAYVDVLRFECESYPAQYPLHAPFRSLIGLWRWFERITAL